MLACGWLWAKLLQLHLEVDVVSGWKMLDPVAGFSNLLNKGTDARRHVGADGGRLLRRGTTG